MERIESPVYRRLGNSGLVVPSVGIGCNNLGRPGTPTRTQEGTNESPPQPTPASASSTSPTSTAPNPASPKPCSAPPSPSSASTATN